MTKFLLEDAVFAIGDNGTAGLLDDLLANAVQLYHRLEVDPDGPHFVAWLASRDHIARGRWRSILATGPDRMLRARCRVEVRVLSVSDWTSDPPQLTLADAARLSRVPAELVVENARNDRTFLEVFAFQDQLDKLEEAVSEGALTITSRGGITEMCALARERRRDKFAAFRTYFLCDSDALAPGIRSPDAKALAAIWPANFHVLNRRAAENYLPREALDRWAGNRSDQVKKVAAFFGKYFNENPARRHHFNMKKGFAKDDKHDRKAERGTLYDAIPVPDQEALSSGFGPKVREAYEPPPSQDELVREGGWHELNHVVSEILSLVR
jgi:hypothetical protein